MAEPVASDPYAAARDSIRDTVKWLVAAFAGIGAVVAGSAPFSGIGELALSDPRLWTSIAALLIALVAVGVGLGTTLRVLRSEGLFWSDLVPSQAAPPQNQELESLRELIDQRARDLLPVQSGISSLEELASAYDDAERAALEGSPDGTRLSVLQGWRTYLLQYALYQRMYTRLTGSIPCLFASGALVAIALIVFSWAAKPPKGVPDAPVIQFVFDQAQPKPVRATSLQSVAFAPNSDQPTADGIKAIQAAHTYLQQHPESVLLMTSRSGAASANPAGETLAYRRGQQVRARILGAGISPNRVFFAELIEASGSAAPAPDDSVVLEIVAASVPGA